MVVMEKILRMMRGLRRRSLYALLPVEEASRYMTWICETKLFICILEILGGRM